MGGGPSSEQKSAARSQEQLNAQTAANSREMMQVYKDQLHKIEPFATSRMNNGLPFFDSLTDSSSVQNGQAWAPARAAMIRRFSKMGDLPSGMRERSLADLDSSRARAFDSGLRDNLLVNETAKNNAAAMLVGQQQMANPLGWTGAATQGNNAVMNAPLQSAGMGGLLGGIAGGAASAFF